MSRALVLSGGGPVGIAWETGIVAGLAAEGVDLAAADFIVGTSAGSVVGAQIAMGSDMGALAARYREEGLPGSTGRSSRPPGAEPERMTKLMEAMAELFTSDAPPDERRAKIGAFALSATTAPEDAFVANIASMLGAEDGTWPRRYACTAVDANTGAFVEWDEANCSGENERRRSGRSGRSPTGRSYSSRKRAQRSRLWHRTRRLCRRWEPT